jgi:hypothetical protein
MTSDSRIREWVLEHRVTWELGPLQEIVDHRLVTVGFELRLFAQHSAGAHPLPGCGECLALHDRLRAITIATLPHERRASWWQLAPFDAAFHLRPESEWRPEVELTVQILHRNGSARPLDASEKRCADEVQQALRDLGAQPRSWSDARGAQHEARSSARQADEA